MKIGIKEYLATGVVILILVTGALFVSECEAGTLEAQFLSSTGISDNHNQNIGKWDGWKLNYVFDNDIYIFGSKENIDAQLMSGQAWNYGIEGIGVGVKHPISKHFGVFSQVGYYTIKKNSIGERPESTPRPLNRRRGSGSVQTFDEPGVETSDHTYGLTVGAELFYPISKHWKVITFASYRYLTFDQGSSDYSCPRTSRCNRVIAIQDRNLSSVNAGLGIGYTF